MSDRPPDGDGFDSAACGLLHTRQDGTIMRVNEVFCAWLGRPAEDLVGRPLQALFTPAGRLFYQMHWAPQVRVAGSVAEIKLDVLHRDGERVPMLFNARRRGPGEAAILDVAAMVVRDREKYERELMAARATAEAAQRALAREGERKDQFLATLAHELRNPLSPLLSGVGVLKLPGVTAAATARVVDVFDRQVRQLARLVDDLLEISRITQGKLVLRPARFDLHAALADAIDAAMPAIGRASHRFHREVLDGPLWLTADATRVTQMVFNLLDNATRFTPPGGDITLRVEVGEHVVITVRDTGIGIPEANLAWIFEMFSQVNPETQRVTGGLGIGLALVKGLAALHGGSVAVRSAGEGQGSEFTLTLPREAGGVA